MKLINYVEYKHSYAHALAPKLKTLNYQANVQKKPVQYIRKIIINALNEHDVHYTDKEQQFFDNIHTHIDGQALYYYVRNCINKAKETKGKPTAILAKTVKGKGVSFMEDNAGWHGKAPNDEEYAIAMEELTKEGEKLCQM